MHLGGTELVCRLSDLKDKIFITYHGYALFFETINIKGKELHLYTPYYPAEA